MTFGMGPLICYVFYDVIVITFTSYFLYEFAIENDAQYKR